MPKSAITESGQLPCGQWYAVHVRSNFEKRVAGELAAKSLETYLPAVEEVSLRAQ